MQMLIKIGQPVLVGKIVGVSSKNHRIAVTFDDGYQSVLKNAIPVMRQWLIPATIFITTGCLGKKPNWVSPDHAYVSEVVLSEEQLMELSEDLVTIGSHSVTHPQLSEVDKGVVKRELNESKKVIERIIQKPVILFALPYGSYCKDVIQDCIDSGYEKIFLNIPTFRFPKPEDIVLGRINVTLDEWPLEYWLKLCGAYRWIGLASAFKRSIYKVIVRAILNLKRAQEC